MSETLTPRSPLRSDCHRLANILPMVSIVLAVLIVLDTTGPWLVRWPGASQALARLITLVAPAAYVIALWRLGRVLKLFGDTGRLIAAAGKALGNVGWALAIGGAFQTLAAPALQTLTGHGPGYWIGLDSAAIALAALGLALVVLARIFNRAARLEAELDQIL